MLVGILIKSCEISSFGSDINSSEDVLVVDIKSISLILFCLPLIRKNKKVITNKIKIHKAMALINLSLILL